MNKNVIVIVASLLMAPAGFVSSDTKPFVISSAAPSADIKTIALDNPDRKIVEAEIQAVSSRYKKPTYEPPRMARPMQVETPALSRLFPKHRFYIIAWGEVAARTLERKMVPVAGRLYFTWLFPRKVSR